MHYPTRPVDKEKAEQELVVNIRKATTAEESAPKQKHVRKCIVYTWDYHSSIAFWLGLRVQPILSDEVQSFKALITVHKVVQEGHPITIKEAHDQTGWLETCGRTVGTDGGRGYGPLIKTYVAFLLSKLKFHRLRPEFNGLFEYEEYVTLKGIDDPNEGYETISDLMGLQDQIDSFQRLVFSHFRHSPHNECRISALVPLVKETWGIYRFITSMLRAMYRRTDDIDALEPLQQRYILQHRNLRNFYHECSNLKYLTGLINVPRLGQDAPNLLDSGEGGDAPDLPQRPRLIASSPLSADNLASTDTIAVNQQARLLAQYEVHQEELRAQREELALQQRNEYEAKRQEQAERQLLAQEQLLQGQLQRHDDAITISAHELEKELLALKSQCERDQLLLEQYDRRVKFLETELNVVGANVLTEMSTKDQLFKELQDQSMIWKNKYEALAKLYSQLRTEHLDLLSKVKRLQVKANSAQEAIERMERMEREVKAKNLELADMIRERDRARFDLDRRNAKHKEESDRLKSDIMVARDRADDAARYKDSELSNVLIKYNQQLAELEDELHTKQQQMDDLLLKVHSAEVDRHRMHEEKDQEIVILQEGLDNTIKQLHESRQTQNISDEASTAEIDNLILDNRRKLDEIIDCILQACMQKVEQDIYELESPTPVGHLSTTPEYALSMIEQAIHDIASFSTVFDLYISGEVGGDHVSVIRTAHTFAASLSHVLIGLKGTMYLAEDDGDISERILGHAREVGGTVAGFFLSLQSYKLHLLPMTLRREVVTRGTHEVRGSLTTLSELVELLIPKGIKDRLADADGNIADIVEKEMIGATQVVEMALLHLQELIDRPGDVDSVSAVGIPVHDSILALALAIAKAINRLILAATKTQQEVAAQGMASDTARQYYKRNNRWTEGLISAANAVAFATTLLIENADGVLTGSRSLEQLLVVSNEVAAATAQLVSASRVKASWMPVQEGLEIAAKDVTEACRALVKHIKVVTTQEISQDDFDYQGLTDLEFKRRELEQQVKILHLEKDLNVSRRRLGAMRRAGYHAEPE